MSAGRKVPTRGDFERIRVALALCLAVERGDEAGFELLRESLPPENLIKGLVGAVRSLAHAAAKIRRETPTDLLLRLIDDALTQEAARW